MVGNDEIGKEEDRFFFLSNVKLNDSGRGYNFGTDFGYNRPGVSISRYEDPLSLGKLLTNRIMVLKLAYLTSWRFKVISLERNVKIFCRNESLFLLLWDCRQVQVLM